MNSHSINRPKLFFIISNFHGAGAQITTVALANWLVRETSLEVSIVVFDRSGPVGPTVDSSIRVIDLGVLRVSQGAFTLASVFRREKPSIVISTLSQVNVVSVIAKFLSMKKIPLLVWERNIVKSSLFTFSSLNQWLLLKLMRFTYRFSDGLISNSPDTQESLEGFGIGGYLRKWVLPNVIEHNPSTMADEELPETRGRKWILGVGRLVEQKGFDFLIDALAHLEDESIYLVIVGEGPEEGRLRERAVSAGVSDRVVFTGFHRNPRLLMKNCDVFVLSSRWEGFGNVLVEALQEGATIVSTDCPGGPRWILDGGRFGFLVDADSPVALSRGIERALLSPLVPQQASVQRGMDFRAKVVGQRFMDECIVEFVR